jgi:hypothetical protein
LEKSEKLRFCRQNKLLFKHPALQPLGSFSHMATCRSSLENTKRIKLTTLFEQKFIIGSYGVGIGCAWCCQKACEICNSLVQKTKLKKIHFSTHRLPKQQTTSFWSQGILGVKVKKDIKFIPPNDRKLGLHARSFFYGPILIFNALKIKLDIALRKETRFFKNEKLDFILWIVSRLFFL